METIDIIRELMPMMSSAGEGAFIIALAVVLKGYAVNLIWALLLGSGVYWVVRAIMTSVTTSERIHHAIVFRDKIVSLTGASVGTGASDTSRTRAVEIIKDLQNKREQNPARDALLRSLLTLLDEGEAPIDSYAARSKITRKLEE